MKNKGVSIQLSEFLGDKPFKDVEREDILSFLTKQKKSISNDPKQTWIDHVILDN